ncbi:STE20-like serine/threonine-protein kinase [Lingula anatina]|uniref:STE20-like serine/threonine-protein kinase n=1 Tax=Lingula anatina TaxID=7574 RepID=A0A1S3HUQ7_LINAN|nr:STE20-like serine/threonine-protein kinase [Lingula anatina]|eukprot:XP_013389777.1 STE20-like serine/threonine-protein kinase [Lingula anatina]
MAESQCVVKLGRYRVNMLDKLGQGAFGVVYRGVDTKTETQIAAKQIELKETPEGGDALAELKAMQSVPSHDNIIKLLDFQYHGNSYWILVEYCDCGDLTAYFKNYTPVPDATKLELMLQVSAAVNHLHSQPEPVTHRDLKPQNIMLRYGATDDRPVVKVTDFGLSKSADTGKTFLMNTVAGTPCFMSPEQFSQEGYTSSVDIFAMGLIFLGMINFDEVQDILPMYKEDIDAGMAIPPGLQLLNAAKSGLDPPVLVRQRASDGTLVEQVKKVIEKMVCFDKSNRPLSKEVTEMLQGIFSQISKLPPPPPKPKAEPIAMLEQHRAETRSDEMSKNAGAEDDVTALALKVTKQVVHEDLERAIREDSGAVGFLRALEERNSQLDEILKQITSDDSDDDGDTDGDLAKLQKGDRVEVDLDEEKVKKLQVNHGGWNTRMKHYLGVKGKVESKTRRRAVVRFTDGQRWSYNIKALRKIEADEDTSEDLDDFQKSVLLSMGKHRDVAVEGLFKKYDIVKLSDEEEIVKLLQEGHGGWNERMKLSLGVKGLVNRVEFGNVRVEFVNGDTWALNPEVLIKAEEEETGNDDLETGDFVLIRPVSEQEARLLQQDHGGWAAGMEKSLGHTGVVKDVLPGSKVKVEVSQQPWVYNKSLITLVCKKEEMVRVLLRRQSAL